MTKIVTEDGITYYITLNKILCRFLRCKKVATRTVTIVGMNDFDSTMCCVNHIEWAKTELSKTNPLD